MRTKLLQKYGSLIFNDIDEGDVTKTISKNKLELFRGSGWHVMAEPPEYDGTNDEFLELFVIDEDILIYLFKNTEQPDELNVRMVEKKNEEDDSDENTDSNTNDDTNE